MTTDCDYYQNGTGQCAHSAPAGGGSADALYTTATPATTADPSGQTTTDTYYPGGQPDAVTNPAGTSTDAYDAKGDLTSVTYSGTASGYTAPTNLSYTYNSDGSRHTMVDATGTTTYSYDADGDVTSQALVAASGTGLAKHHQLQLLHHRGAGHHHLPGLPWILQPAGHLQLRRHRGHGL